VPLLIRHSTLGRQQWLKIDNAGITQSSNVLDHPSPQFTGCGIVFDPGRDGLIARYFQCR
jgi:hypothetical protein